MAPQPGVERLFVYGSLQPGGSNEHVLADLDGVWKPASVRGRLLEVGWGAGLGYPALVLDPEAGRVPGFVLASPSLSDRWADLDEFEGHEYERVSATVRLADGGEVEAEVYVLRLSLPG